MNPLKVWFQNLWNWQWQWNDHCLSLTYAQTGFALLIIVASMAICWVIGYRPNFNPNSLSGDDYRKAIDSLRIIAEYIYQGSVRGTHLRYIAKQVRNLCWQTLKETNGKELHVRPKEALEEIARLVAQLLSVVIHAADLQRPEVVVLVVLTRLWGEVKLDFSPAAKILDEIAEAIMSLKNFPTEGSAIAQLKPPRKD